MFIFIDISTVVGAYPNNAVFSPAENINFNWYFANDLHEASKSRKSYFSIALKTFLAFSDRYLTAFFKSMSCTLTIGYGLYTPVDSNDLLVTMLVIFVGAIVFALTVSQLIAMMDQINVGSLKFKVTC